ncbi:flagellar hook-basal body complex protein FliE [Paramicrobacterium agarici]|uniref:Flagellar hook-basal body complex protein FliE n=1 Tax=Paramicrobacterium agarici TaxID=630514 RepID=A0A2A9DXF1_9MICO|nr:flagellar hook-basal body complex protein FliE [Microbacterium agarici]PFG30610.1 flagellar hook-basal body complex protein FliE [Microbacterium agarici]TQO23628.1 flagellar hook-basal body complex protein FliE [Microbacterium agarici]
MPISPIDGPSQAAAAFTPPTLETQPASDGGFGASLTGAIDDLQQLKATSNELSVAAVTGDLSDIHAASIASARAAVTLELVAAVRNKGVAAFNEIMRMQA